MALPSILQLRKRKVAESSERAASPTSPPPKKTEHDGDGDLPPTTAASNTNTQTQDQPQDQNLTKAAIHRATRTRRLFAISASVSYLLSFIFLVLVMIGNTYPRRVLDDMWFFKLDLADIIPLSVPNANLINSIAQSIGLHDFYQVGLWNFCEGYEGVGITFCSPPQTLYWFNPVEIIMSELLAGATVALPTNVVLILDVLRISSQIMFGFFLTGAVLAFLLTFASPLAVRTRWWSLPLAFFAFLNALFVGVACIVGSTISFAFKYAAEAQSDLNIHVQIGVKMFVFMWLAAGFALWGFAVHAGMGCCCVSRRDLTTGRRHLRGGIVQVAK